MGPALSAGRSGGRTPTIYRSRQPGKRSDYDHPTDHLQLPEITASSSSGEAGRSAPWCSWNQIGKSPVVGSRKAVAPSPGGVGLVLRRAASFLVPMRRQ